MATSPAEAGTRPSGEASTSNPASSPRLLCVDDDRRNRETLVRRLLRHGYQVDAAAGGREALAWLEHHPCDLVLLDWQMPEVSGLDVLRAIRAEQSPSSLPVVMLTGKAASEDVVEALELGANDYITKPIDLPVALARIRTQLARSLAERALRDSEERYALAARGANDGLWDLKVDTGEVYFSPRWKAIIGYAGDDLPATLDAWFERVHPDDIARLRHDLDQHLKGATPHLEVEHRLRHRDGRFRWVSCRAVAVRDGGRAVRVAGSLTDITEGKVADALTGLPNRALFHDRLGRLFALARRRPDVQFAVMYLDLDGFKTINDSLGHDVGDRLLVLVAERLETSLRTTDTVTRVIEEPHGGGVGTRAVARLGGDEFAVLLAGLEGVGGATRVAERIADAFREPFHLDGQDLFIEVSVGIAFSGAEYTRPEEMVRDADTALHEAKAAGKGRYAVFDATMREAVIERLELQNDMRRGLEANEFRLHYQPILRLDTEEVVGFEALLRWQHPTRGLLSPATFIPVAEESGLIVPLGAWAMNEACRQLRIWLDARPSADLKVAVNVAARQLVQRDFDRHVAAVLSDVGLEPHHLELEVTESSLIVDPEAARRTLVALREMGVRLSIDDFGTGYSSLSYLRSFPFHHLKIDRSFVVDFHENDSALTVVRTILDLASQLGLEVVAEGIETFTQKNQLRALNCQYAQGYYFAKPLTAASATDLVRRPSSEQRPSTG